MEKRVFLIVLDSFGIGAEPDAAAFGDEGTNTLGAIAKHPNFNCPNLRRLGMFNLDGVTAGEKTDAPIGAFARLQEQSMGKDTTIGHWEIAGVVSRCPPSRTASRRVSFTNLRRRPATRCCATSPTPAPRC